MFRPAAQVGVHTGQNGLLIHVVAYHIGNVGIDAFVVGDARAGCVNQGHVAEFVRVQQAGHAKKGIRTKDQRIEKVVVDTPVDDVDTPEAGCGAHVDKPVVHQEISAFDQRRPDLTGKKHMLVERRIVNARRQQNDAWIGPPLRRELDKGFAEKSPVMFYVLHARAPVEAAQSCLHRLTVRHHIRNP